MPDLKEKSSSLLSATTIALDGDGDTTLYTVPVGKRLILSHAILVAGGDAGATTTITIGKSGTTTDFLASNIVSNLDAQYDAVVLKPIPNTTPLKSKSYVAGSVITATIGSQSGTAVDSTLYLYGTLY